MAAKKKAGDSRKRPANTAAATNHTPGDVAMAVYQDALAPAIREAGAGVAIVLAMVNAVLAASYLKMAYGGRFVEQCKERLRARIERIPEARRIDPAPEVVGPLLAHYPYVAAKPDLREMFENLLASSTDRDGWAHPSFVEVLKQLNADEAKLCVALHARLLERGEGAPLLLVLSYEKDEVTHRVVGSLSFLDFVEGLQAQELLSVFEDNLVRLSLIKKDTRAKLANQSAYVALANQASAKFAEWKEDAAKQGRTLQVVHGILEMTNFGFCFLDSCVAALPRKRPRQV